VQCTPLHSSGCSWYSVQCMAYHADALKKKNVMNSKSSTTDKTHNHLYYKVNCPATHHGCILGGGEIIPWLHFTPGVRIGGWVGPRAGLDAGAGRKILCLSGIKPQSSSPQSDTILPELPWLPSVLHKSQFDVWFGACAHRHLNVDSNGARWQNVLFYKCYYH
jgi:hypothetical protein